MADRAPELEQQLRRAMTPPPQTLPDNSVTGGSQSAGTHVTPRRAHPGRDAALAGGRDPLSRTTRPAGV